MIKKTTTIPPDVFQFFSRALLETPVPKLCDDCTDLLRVYEHIKNHLERKCSYHPKRVEKFKKLEKEFLDLYERTKKTEEDRKADKENPYQGSFSYFSFSNRRNREIFTKIKYKRKRKS